MRSCQIFFSLSLVLSVCSSCLFWSSLFFYSIFSSLSLSLSVLPYKFFLVPSVVCCYDCSPLSLVKWTVLLYFGCCCCFFSSSCRDTCQHAGETEIKTRACCIRRTNPFCCFVIMTKKTNFIEILLPKQREKTNKHPLLDSVNRTYKYSYELDEDFREYASCHGIVFFFSFIFSSLQKIWKQTSAVRFRQNKKFVKNTFKNQETIEKRRSVFLFTTIAGNLRTWLTLRSSTTIGAG